MHIINFVSIGFIDSGIGGLTILSECKKAFPKANFIYIADTKYAPYGIKSANFLLGRSCELVKELARRGAQAVVFACNSCSVSTTYEKLGEVPIIRVLPDIEKALKGATKKVLLMATPVTVKNLSDSIKDLKELVILADETLATRVENSVHDFFSLKKYLSDILLPYKDCEGIVLGCTHYLYLIDTIKSILPDIKIYHSNDQVIKALHELNIPQERGDIEILVTGKENNDYHKLLQKLLKSY